MPQRGAEMRYYMEHKNWEGFKKGIWQDEINVRDFIQLNYTEYHGDDSFLAPATKRTNELMKKLQQLFLSLLCNWSPAILHHLPN